MKTSEAIFQNEKSLRDLELIINLLKKHKDNESRKLIALKQIRKKELFNSFFHSLSGCKFTYYTKYKDYMYEVSSSIETSILDKTENIYNEICYLDGLTKDKPRSLYINNFLVIIYIDKKICRLTFSTKRTSKKILFNEIKEILRMFNINEEIGEI